MKKLLSLLLMLTLCAGWLCTATAELETTATKVLTIHPNSSPSMQRTANLAVIRIGESTHFFDIDGQQLTTDGYSGYTYDYHQYSSTYTICGLKTKDPLNNMGVVNKQGVLVTDECYGNVEFFSDKWFAAVVLRDADKGINDYASSYGHVQIERVDIFFEGKKITSLKREQFGTATARGDYLYMTPHVHSSSNRGSHAVITPTGAYLPASSGVFEYELRFDANYEQYYFHTGSQQKAFVPDCTLTTDEVDGCILYDGNGNFIDLQGNLLFSSELVKRRVGSEVLSLYQDRYVLLYTPDDYFMFDITGNLIARSDTFIGTGVSNRAWSAFMATGYQLLVGSNGTLCFVDAQGQLVLDTGVARADARACGNIPFVLVQDASTSKYTVYTPVAGKLATVFNDVNPDGYSAHSRILSMVKGRKFGVIDLYGNTIIDFIYDQLIVSIDGTMVVATRTDTWPYVTDIYRIDYTDPAAVEAARLEAEAQAAAEAARLAAEAEAQAAAEAEAARLAAEAEAAARLWHCDACNRDNDMAFCPLCGGARPAPKPVCQSCGYEAPEAGYKFCPACGTKF